MVSLRAHLKKASRKQKEKYTTKEFSKWGSKSVATRTAGMTTEQKSEYFRNIRKGIKVSEL